MQIEARVRIDFLNSDLDSDKPINKNHIKQVLHYAKSELIEKDNLINKALTMLSDEHIRQLFPERFEAL